MTSTTSPAAHLRVSLVQAATRWHDADANRALYASLVEPLAGRTDLVVLPETFTSGFSNAAVETAEGMDGPTLPWLRALAAQVDAVVCGSAVVREGDAVFNRFLWMTPDGTCLHYDKRHLFRMAGEHTRYAAGAARPVFTLRGWRVLPQVCYDLRFPVWLRNRFDAGRQALDYDLAIFVANWPAPRRHAWRTLLAARAIENLAYVVGVNRVGEDGNGLAYSGDSAALDPLGEPLVALGAQAQVATAVLERAVLDGHRARFPAWMDADRFTLALAD